MAALALLRRLTPVLLVLPLTTGAQTATKPIEIRFQLVDADGQALAHKPVRLVLAFGNDWQLPEAGWRARTGSDGGVNWQVDAAPERRRRKLPTNFLTQTFSAAEETQHIAIGAELTYLGRTWLVVAAADRFDNGTTVQSEGLRIYGADPAGRFSLPVTGQNGAWRFPGVAGALTTQGFSVQQLVIAPAAQGWTVELVLKKDAEPVVR